MAKTNNLTDFLTSEADKFRSVLGTQGTIDPQDFDDLIDDVYDKGFTDGRIGHEWIFETQDFTPAANTRVSEKSWTASSMTTIYYMVITSLGPITHTSGTLLQNTFTGDIISTKYTIYLGSTNYNVSTGAVYTISGNTAARSGSVSTSFQAGTTYRAIFIGK